MTYSIRVVTPPDVPSLARLHLRTALTAYAGIFPTEAPKPVLADTEGRWARYLSEGIGWLASEGGEVVGMAALLPGEPHGGRLEAVYVDPLRWGRGIGDALADTAEAEAVVRGWLPLHLWVLEANHRARQWYERRGWGMDPSARRTVWGSVVDLGYVLTQEGVSRWQR